MKAFVELAATDEMTLGQGLNFISGDMPAHAVIPVVSGLVPAAPLPTNVDKIFLRVVKDTRSYQRLYSDVASLSGSGLMWSASATLNYLREQTSSTTSLSYVAARIVKSQAMQADLSAGKTSAAALQFLKDKGAAAFVERYGTHFVCGFTYGGTFIGRFRLETASATDKESLAVSMNASIKGFGVSGSISNDFRNDLKTASTSYTLSNDIQITGQSAPSIDEQDPDAMVKACGAYAPSAHGGTTGNRVTAICVSWEVLPDIQSALEARGESGALSYDIPEDGIATLANEYAKLSAVAGTCTSLIDSRGYALPAYEGVLRNIRTRALEAQNAIAKMTLPQLVMLTPARTAQFTAADQLNELLSPISHGQITIKVDYNADGGFKRDGQFSKTLHLVLSGDEIQVDRFQHSRGGNSNDQQFITYYVKLTEDAEGRYLQTHTNWNDPYGPGSGDWYGQKVMLDSPTFATGVSSARWPTYDYNGVAAQLVGA